MNAVLEQQTHTTARREWTDAARHEVRQFLQELDIDQLRDMERDLKAEIRSRPEGLNPIVTLATGSLGFAVCVLSVLLSILLDLAGNTAERVRLLVELLAVLGVGGFAIWKALGYRR